MTEEQIKYMVDRFLSWKLPANFAPDAGITFTPEYNVEYNAIYGRPPQRHEPVGTNLFDAAQAEAMIRYIVEGLPLPRSTKLGHAPMRCPACRVSSSNIRTSRFATEDYYGPLACYCLTCGHSWSSPGKQLKNGVWEIVEP